MQRIVMTKEVAAMRVAKGVALLDQKKPGWDNLIDTDLLRMRCGCLCILGQIYDIRNSTVVNSFSDAACRLFCDSQIITATSMAADHGFDFDPMLGETADDYTTLQDAWIEVIAARRFPVVEEVVSCALWNMWLQTAS